MQGGEDYLQGLAARYAQELGIDRGAVARQLAELQLEQLQQQHRPPGSPTSASSANNIYATIGSAGGGSSSAGLGHGPGAGGVGAVHTYANIARGSRGYQPGSYAVSNMMDI